MIYLDNNATTQPAPEVVEAMTRSLRDCWHNPSSLHRPGQVARREVEAARRATAGLIGARPRDLVFTAGGTESINLAIRGSILSTGRRAVVTTHVEHAAIRELCETLAHRDGIEIRFARLDEEGLVDLTHLRTMVDDDVAVVSIQWANNETGLIQPIHAIGRLCRDRNVLFHSDGTQWVGKAPTNVAEDPVDLLTFSAHKFHGPKGVGALSIRPGLLIASTIQGEQEFGVRGGTENTPGIVGLGAACRLSATWLSNPDNLSRAAALRDRFEQALRSRIPDLVVNASSSRSQRLWNTSSVIFPDVDAESILFTLSERGVCASSGSACSSGAFQPSKVLQAFGLSPEEAASSIRFSICRETTENEVDEAAAMVADCVLQLRALQATA